MNLLLLNDDGIDAPGLAALRRVARPLGTLHVSAPAEEQSGIGHRVTTGKPFRIERRGERETAVHGTPADAARVALCHRRWRIDLALSGINRGGNMGADVYISGTAAAAREAALQGVPAVGISQYVGTGVSLDGQPAAWDWTVRQAGRALAFVREIALLPQTYWNVNLPSPVLTAGDPDIVRCPLDPHPLLVEYEETAEGIRYVGRYHDRSRDPGSDVDVCMGGRIAVTLLTLAPRDPGVQPEA